MQDIEKYLKELFGKKFIVRSIHKKELKGLPLYLTGTYTPYELDLFGKQIVIIKKIGNVNETPAKIEKDVAKFRKYFEKDVAVLLKELVSWERKRLIEKNIPFIVLGRQLYLPMFLLDLRENFSISTVSPDKYLSWAAQHTLLRQILRGDVENRSMADIATLLGYSAMMMTKVKSELVALDLCDVKREGRSKRIVFSMPKEQLWKESLSNMRSPVFRTHFLAGNISSIQSAGLSALAEKSLIQPDKLPTFAVWKKGFKSVVNNYSLVETENEEVVDLILEEWYYDPESISENDMVDPLSLYLSFRSNPSERIQIAIKDMLETVTW